MDYAEEQRQHWDSAPGHAWVASQILARLFEPLADRLADLAAARRPDQLLHVGCGTGSSRPMLQTPTAASHVSWSVSGRRRSSRPASRWPGSSLKTY